MTREKLGDLEQEKQWTEYKSADSSCDNCGDPPIITSVPLAEVCAGLLAEHDVRQQQGALPPEELIWPAKTFGPSH